MLAFINTIAGRIAIGAAIGLLVLVAFLSFRLQGAEAKIAARDATIAQTIAANETLVASNEALQVQSAKDGAALRGLRIVQARLAADAERRRADLDRLARSSPDVQDALSAPYPLALVCLRDAQNGVPNADCPDQGE